MVLAVYRALLGNCLVVNDEQVSAPVSRSLSCFLYMQPFSKDMGEFTIQIQKEQGRYSAGGYRIG